MGGAVGRMAVEGVAAAGGGLRVERRGDDIMSSREGEREGIRMGSALLFCGVVECRESGKGGCGGFGGVVLLVVEVEVAAVGERRLLRAKVLFERVRLGL